MRKQVKEHELNLLHCKKQLCKKERKVRLRGVRHSIYVIMEKQVVIKLCIDIFRIKVIENRSIYEPLTLQH